MRYSCSISFRELKNAIKISFFLYLGGLGTKIRFSSRKKMGQNIGTGGRAWGKILGRCEVYTGIVTIRTLGSIGPFLDFLGGFGLFFDDFW